MIDPEDDLALGDQPDGTSIVDTVYTGEVVTVIVQLQGVELANICIPGDRSFAQDVIDVIMAYFESLDAKARATTPEDAQAKCARRLAELKIT